MFGARTDGLPVHGSLSRVVRPLVALVAAALLVGLVPALPTEARVPSEVVSREVTQAVDRQRVFKLPIVASHVALHWRGDEEAILSVAFSADGLTFGDAILVEHDDAGGHAVDGRNYSGVIWTEGARFARVTSDRRLAQVSVVAMDSRATHRRPTAGRSVAAAAVDEPAIISRAGWGAKESLRYDADGNELWPREFYPVQKLVVHHTAGRNGDPDPASTVRAIYHYQAVVRGWNDIGYNFLIDEAGRIYEGRHSREYEAGETLTGEDVNGYSVVGAHVAHHNSGTIGIALLGTLSNRDATPAARAALEWLLAWKAERHGIDPLGRGVYTNPVTGLQKDLPNISGHRDLAATLCPGGTFYRTLPALRAAVAARIAGTQTVPGAPVLSARTAPKRPGVRLNWTAPGDGGSPISEYRILRWNKKKARFVRIAIVGGYRLTYRDANTRSGRTYRYVVRAVNAVGKGPRSNEASAVAR